MTWEEINAAIEEKVASATEGLDGDDADEAKAKELKNMDQSVRQFLWNGGHKAATKQNAEKIESLESERESLQEQIEEKERQLEELKEVQPDAEKIEAEYQEEIKELKEQHAAAVEELRQKIRDRDKGSFRNRVFARVSKILDSDYVDVQLQRMEAQGRIKIDDDGDIEILQPGKEIPYMADSEEALVETVVEELASEAPDKWKVSNADSGGGSSGSGGGPNKSSKYERAREAGKQTQEYRQRRTKSLSERVGKAA